MPRSSCGNIITKSNISSSGNSNNTNGSCSSRSTSNSGHSDNFAIRVLCWDNIKLMQRDLQYNMNKCSTTSMTEK